MSQKDVEARRAVYAKDSRTLLQRLNEVHGITVRQFAAIFHISKSHAEQIINHKKLPSLEDAINIARYWECSVEDLFGWRVDDIGSRRPLIVEVNGLNENIRLSSYKKEHRSVTLAIAMAEGRIEEQLIPNKPWQKGDEDDSCRD